jgi:hypothetical protein
LLNGKAKETASRAMENSVGKGWPSAIVKVWGSQTYGWCHNWAGRVEGGRHDGFSCRSKVLMTAGQGYCYNVTVADVRGHNDVGLVKGGPG